jgi:hypothetical protein
MRIKEILIQLTQRIMKQIHNHSFVNVIAAIILLGLPVLVSGQSNTDGSMPQYLFSQFDSGTIRMKNGQAQTQVMNYNTVTEKMVFTKGDKFYDLTNPDKVDTITIEGCKFVPVGKSFYQVLCAGKTNLYIQYFSSLLPPGKTVGFGGTSQLASADYLSSVKLEGGEWDLKLPSDYTVASKPVYWIRRRNDWSDFTTEKQFLKLFPDKASVLKEHIKANKVKFDKPESLAKLMEYLNSL